MKLGWLSSALIVNALLNGERAVVTPSGANPYRLAHSHRRRWKASHACLCRPSGPAWPVSLLTAAAHHAQARHSNAGGVHPAAG